jgi:acetoin utilization protein AcuB
MLVGNRMAQPVITIRPDVPVQDALVMMRKEHVRRFPVVDENGNLVGIVSESDLLNASPSEATSLSAWEINYLISKITVSKVMSKRVITIPENTPIEEAARIMADNKIGSLPVMRGSDLVGIMTETSLFKVLLELMGARENGVRLTASLKNEVGALNRMTDCIQKLGGNIIALGTFMGQSAAYKMVVVKVSGVDAQTLKSEVSQVVESIQDLRD